MSKKDQPYGFKIIYKDGNSETRWYATKSERDHYYNMMKSTTQYRVKDIKKKQR